MSQHSLKVGLSFGLTSGIITTLGLMVGLSSGTNSKLVVIGGILTIAIADAFSDALGIHVAEESEDKHTPKEIWVATLSTFFSKFFFALTFVIPIILCSLQVAVIVSTVWGLSMLSILSYVMAREQKKPPFKSILEHLFIAIIVIAATHSLGHWISQTFGQN